MSGVRIMAMSPFVKFVIFFSTSFLCIAHFVRIISRIMHFTTPAAVCNSHLLLHSSQPLFILVVRSFFAYTCTPTQALWAGALPRALPDAAALFAVGGAHRSPCSCMAGEAQPARVRPSHGDEAAAAGGGQALLAVEGAKNMCMEEKDKCWNNEK